MNFIARKKQFLHFWCKKLWKFQVTRWKWSGSNMILIFFLVRLLYRRHTCTKSKGKTPDWDSALKEIHQLSRSRIPAAGLGMRMNGSLSYAEGWFNQVCAGVRACARAGFSFFFFALLSKVVTWTHRLGVCRPAGSEVGAPGFGFSLSLSRK